MATLGEVAAALCDAERSASAIAPLKLADRSFRLDDAYAIQKLACGQRQSAGAPVVGRKVAMTSQAVQLQFGIAHPTFGFLHRPMLHLHGGTLAAASLLQPRAEAEIAFVLNRDLADPGCSYVEVLRAIDFAVVAIEIADCRIEGWKADVLDFVADNSAAAAVVLGETPFSVRDLELRSLAMQMHVGGQLRAEGAGAACLGNPLLSLLWLARCAAEQGVPLVAGDLIMSGSLGPAVPVAKGDRVQVRIGHFAPVAIEID